MLLLRHLYGALMSLRKVPAYLALSAVSRDDALFSSFIKTVLTLIKRRDDLHQV
jgi:hypothetical protein